MHVVATAGHVDHGKSTLVRALTGMEPDRWAEERRRGMTIDLGFAWTDLPSGQRVAFVDVPGHERFVSNMLAGVGPVPAAILVIAADEGWRAQTEEHVEALRALGLRHLVVVVTRCDLTDPTPVLAEVRGRLGERSLEPIAAVAVSAVTGQGLDTLRTALDRLVAVLPGPAATAPLRLWVDRAFTIHGAGLVVTGTLAAGRIAVGDEVDLAPGGRGARVRGLQVCKERRTEVTGVARVAVNLRGVAAGIVRRGDALVAPGTWRAVEVTDVRLSEPLPAAELTLHIGSAAVGARVRPLGPAPSRFARLSLAAPLPLRVGDRGLIRDPGQHRIAAGVVVLDVAPGPLRRRGGAAARAAALSAVDVPLPDDMVRWRGSVRRADLRSMGVFGESRSSVGVRDWLVSPDQWARWQRSLGEFLDHPVDPLARGRTPASLVHDLSLPDAVLLDRLVKAVGAVSVDGWVRRPGAVPRWADATEQALTRIEARLRAAPFAAPEQPELTALGLSRRELAAAVQAGRLIQIDPGIFLLPGALDVAVERLRQLPDLFTVADVRRVLSATRRVVLPLLQHLDAAGRTSRVDAAHRRVVR